MDLDRLDFFSRTFADLLFASYPEWIALAANERQVGQQEDYLVVVVPGESQADLNEPLWITTNDNEITVGIDSYHLHFNEWPKSSFDSSVHEWDGHRAALDFVKSVIEEKTAIVTVWSDGRNAGGWCEPRERALSMTIENVGLDVRNSLHMPLPSHPGVDNVFRIRSWKGSLNRDLGNVVTG
jgi:hypothetical protein